ncbi:hypothetical protein [Variovorax terrae]|uniref:Tripartite tricarboxylate transporter family receptor n=1 Tax=Variovorax terrae TaxID=2923278 RepID=A0A9X1VUX7_9BURK|nr:hypothetical protein [Variovorax terrae]MCJ0763842.1 hypothetical protein [Variovorax terrae]
MAAPLVLQGIAFALVVGAPMSRTSGPTDLIERLRIMGMEPGLPTGEPFQRFVRDQLDKWGRQIRDAGIQPE